ncbi:MAG TPA: hypothetical protein VFC93_10715 [Chloroflexota bacterium]|nr:hypothetical protein [Chloroflexota bacterium]
MPQKYEREIEEILSRFDSGQAPSGRVLTPLPPLGGGRPRGRRTGWRPNVRIVVNASSLMVASLSLAVLSYPLQWVYPPAVAAAGLAAALMLILAVLLSVFKWNSGRPTRSWRGQPIDLGGGGVGFSPSSLSRRWRRWKAHRRFRDPRWN